MDKKGFTLIELLATITILAMIMLVAVPNIMSTLDKSKRRTYVEDAKKMVTLAEYSFRANTQIEAPSGTSAIAFSLKSMDMTDFSDGPEGGEYDINNSYVIMINDNNSYVYYVTLIEKYGDGNTKYRGIELKKSDDLLIENAINLVSNPDNVKSISKGENIKIDNSTYTINNIY